MKAAGGPDAATLNIGHFDEESPALSQPSRDGTHSINRMFQMLSHMEECDDI